MIGPSACVDALGVGAFTRRPNAIVVIAPSNQVSRRGLELAVAPAIGWSFAGVGVVRR